MSNNAARIHLIVPGAQKAGTTWLQHIFDIHESFWCPPDTPEVHYFDRKYEGDPNYYRRLYAPAPDTNITVDVTPNYLSHEQVPERIRQFDKSSDRDVRFLISLREPVARLRSAFVMKKRKGDERTLNEAVRAGSDLVDKSQYVRHLNRYRSTFSDDRIRTLIFEELIDDKHTAFERIQTFLDVEKPLQDPYEDRTVNTGGMRRFWFLDRLFMLGGRVMRTLGATDLIHALKSSKLLSEIKQSNRMEYTFSKSEEDILRDLKTQFEGKVQELGKLIDRPDLPSVWGYEEG